jgi:hypothetical protein
VLSLPEPTTADWLMEMGRDELGKSDKAIIG